MNTSEFLSIACAIVPDRTALVFNDARFTFDQLQIRVNQLADSLASIGIGQGDRIAVMQVNSHRIIEIYFAAAQLDAIFVPINFRARSEELEQMLRIAEPEILFLGDRYVSLITNADENIMSFAFCRALFFVLLLMLANFVEAILDFIPNCLIKLFLFIIIF